MPTYRERRIEGLKGYAIEMYGELPPNCQAMTMMQYGSWIAEHYSTEATTIHPERIRSVFPAVRFRNAVDSLVDMGVLNFEESTPLQDIVKLLR